MNLLLVLTAAVVTLLLVTLILVRYRRDRIAALAAILFLALQFGFSLQNLGAFGPLRFVIIGACGYLVIIVLIRRTKDLSGGRGILWLFMAYFALLYLVTVINLQKSNLDLYTGILISGLGAALIFAVMTAAERRIALNGIVWMAVGEALYSIIELVFHLPPIWGRGSDIDGAISGSSHNQFVFSLIRSQATLGNPLPLALLLLVAIALIVRGYGFARRPAQILCVIALIIGIFAAGSRSAMMLTLLLLLFSTQNRAWKAVAVGGSAVIVLLTVAGASGFFNSDFFTGFINGSSVTHRFGSLSAIPALLTLQSPLQAFFGNGYFSADSIYSSGLLGDSHFRAVDNQFVLSIIEGGLVLLAVLVVLCVLALRAGKNCRPALLAIIFFFMTFDLLAWPVSTALFGVFIGLGHAESTGKTGTASGSGAARNSRRTVDTAPVVPAAGGLVGYEPID